MDPADLAVGFSAAHAWLLGNNPYDVAVLKHDLLVAGGTDSVIGQLDQLRNVYFPTTLPLFAPIALVAWPQAALLWLALNVVAALFIAFGLCRLLGWRLGSTRALTLSLFILALAPLRTTMVIGQTALAATAALVAAMLLERSGRRIPAGVAYGLAMAVKVQIGLPFFAYLLWRRRWATAAAAGLVVACFTVLSVVRMQAAGVPWLQSWFANLALLSGPGGLNDPGQLNPERYSLINLQYPLRSLFSGDVVDAITFGAVGVAAVAMVWLIRDRRPRAELLALATVAVLCLLVTYHRYYDAVLLALPIAWAFSTLATPRWREGAAVLVLCADFLLPFQTKLHDLQLKGVVPARLADSPFWDTVLVAQQAWALVLLVLVLLWAAAHERSRAPDMLDTVPARAPNR
jgi:hypothetical protein